MILDEARRKDLLKAIAALIFIVICITVGVVCDIINSFYSKPETTYEHYANAYVREINEKKSWTLTL